jgi:hypothetical protein
MTWKARQTLYHTQTKHDDVINAPSTTVTETSTERIIQDIIDYFSVVDPPLKFPAKSFAVAIIYAKLLNQVFGVPFYDALNDPFLLYGNDYFFTPYAKAPDTYDRALASIPSDFTNISLPQVQSTVQYFKQEFLIDEFPVW